MGWQKNLDAHCGENIRGSRGIWSWDRKWGQSWSHKGCWSNDSGWSAQTVGCPAELLLEWMRRGKFWRSLAAGQLNWPVQPHPCLIWIQKCPNRHAIWMKCTTLNEQLCGTQKKGCWCPGCHNEHLQLWLSDQTLHGWQTAHGCLDWMHQSQESMEHITWQ